MKKFISIFLALLLSLTLASCSLTDLTRVSNTSKEGKTTIITTTKDGTTIITTLENNSTTIVESNATTTTENSTTVESTTTKNSTTSSTSTSKDNKTGPGSGEKHTGGEGGQGGGGSQGGGGGSSSSVSWTGATSITSSTTETSGTYSSSTIDEVSLLIYGNITVALSNISVDKTGSSSGGDSTSFYGINSAITAKDGATVTLDNITVTTNATGGNGVFSYGGSATTSNTSSDGTTIIIKNSTITTTGDNSGGIMTTGGGITEATNLIITTSGGSSAAIRTDRGGGTVVVDKGTYKTTGIGSPAIYSTATITVSNATLISEHSEGIIVEGKNNVTINNCELTDTNDELNGKSSSYKNIFLYQSMSGDADSGTSSFTATDSKITTNNGDVFYITNTTAVIELNNNEFINKGSGNFLVAEEGAWGTDGENGGDVTLDAVNQEIIGNILIDSSSSLTMSLTESSSFEGAINASQSNATISLTLDSSSTIKLTGNTYVTSFTNGDSTNSNVDFGSYKLYVNGTAIN